MSDQVPLHERWRDYTAEEISAIKKEKCIQCGYAGRLSVGVESLSGLYCDYLSRTGESRDVRPECCMHYLETIVRDTRPAYMVASNE